MSAVVSLRDLPTRRGPAPSTTTPDIPHQQVDQHPTDPAVGRALATFAFGLAGVEERPSGISVPGARALSLSVEEPVGPDEAFLIGREFAHIHPDHSLHLTLPTDGAAQAVAAGWGEWHPFVELGRLAPTVILVFAPRDTTELDLVELLLRRSRHFAGGTPTDTGRNP